tara:strand:- start:4575 stop:4727 length:153 start_codon:yes stop_codon:yes gene_type:complete
MEYQRLVDLMLLDKETLVKRIDELERNLEARERDIKQILKDWRKTIDLIK